MKYTVISLLVVALLAPSVSDAGERRRMQGIEDRTEVSSHGEGFFGKLFGNMAVAVQKNAAKKAAKCGSGYEDRQTTERGYTDTHYEGRDRHKKRIVPVRRHEVRVDGVVLCRSAWGE